jgi:hypothetical protein
MDTSRAASELTPPTPAMQIAATGPDGCLRLPWAYPDSENMPFQDLPGGDSAG